MFYKHQVIGSIPISPTNRREDRYLDGAHNPVLVGSTPTPATIGAVAHQGERIPCTDEVAGSIPVSSTSGCDGSTPSLPTKKIEKSLHKPLTFTPKL